MKGPQQATAPVPGALRPGCDPQKSYCNATLPAFISSVTNAYQRGRAANFSNVDLSDVRFLLNVCPFRAAFGLPQVCLIDFGLFRRRRALLRARMLVGRGASASFLTL